MSSVASDPPTEPEPYGTGCSVHTGQSIVKKYTVCEIIFAVATLRGGLRAIACLQHQLMRSGASETEPALSMPLH